MIYVGYSSPRTYLLSSLAVRAVQLLCIDCVYDWMLLFVYGNCLWLADSFISAVGASHIGFQCRQILNSFSALFLRWSHGQRQIQPVILSLFYSHRGLNCELFYIYRRIKTCGYFLVVPRNFPLAIDQCLLIFAPLAAPKKIVNKINNLIIKSIFYSFYFHFNVGQSFNSFVYF